MFGLQPIENWGLFGGIKSDIVTLGILLQMLFEESKENMSTAQNYLNAKRLQGCHKI